MADVREYKLFIDGEWVDAASGETFETTNPSDGSLVGKVAKGGKEDMRRAVGAARQRFDAGTWADMPQEERSRRMLKAWEALNAKLSELSQIEAEDAGHTLRMANLFSIALGVEHWRVLSDLATKLGEWEPTPWNDFPAVQWGIVRREPYGVVAAITPWNFPFILMMWKAAPALATGNSIVIKPATYTPMSTLEFARILQETDLFPPGVINVVPGAGAAAGEELASNADVDKVAFTGSTEVGRRIMQLASSTVKKVTLELGGKSANILLDDADLDIAIPGSLWATFLHSGQICHSGTRLFVPASIHDEVIARLVDTAEGLKIGSAMDFETDMGPLVHRTQFDTVERYVQSGLEEGAKLVTGGERALVPGCDGGYYYKPTIFTDVRNDMKIASPLETTVSHTVPSKMRAPDARAVSANACKARSAPTTPVSGENTASSWPAGIHGKRSRRASGLRRSARAPHDRSAASHASRYAGSPTSNPPVMLNSCRPLDDSSSRHSGSAVCARRT